jgi:hypothetical protein
MKTKSVLFDARRGTGLGARGPAGLALPKSAGIRGLPVTIALFKNSMSRSRRGFLLVPVVILSAWFALSPARAVSPPPDGGHPGGNTAEGTDALRDNTTGTSNTAVGFAALRNNTTGSFNAATGYISLLNNTTGVGNTATGFAALASNTTGMNNTASGLNALRNNTTGSFNAATGLNALVSNTTGSDNTATGLNALRNNTTGSFNAATGFNALSNNTTGDGNIALGVQAGLNLTTGDNNIDIGNSGIGGDSNKIRIGRVGTQNATFIAGIRGATVASGVEVIVGLDGQLGTVISSARFKEAIKPMDQASEAILALKPVTFRYKHELDPAGIPQFGLVAEQVEKVNPDLVARDDQGKVNTVRYEAVNAMLLNEFLKEHRKVQELEAAITQLQKDFAQQQKEIKALAASLKEQEAALSPPRKSGLPWRAPAMPNG